MDHRRFWLQITGWKWLQWHVYPDHNYRESKIIYLACGTLLPMHLNWSNMQVKNFLADLLSPRSAYFSLYTDPMFSSMGS